MSFNLNTNVDVRVRVCTSTVHCTVRDRRQVRRARKGLAPQIF